MFMPGEEELDAVEPPATTASVAGSTPTHGSSDALLSPSIQRVVGEQIAAYELKFLIPTSIASKVEAWAVDHMRRDAYSDPSNGHAYQTTTLYLDTPRHDVFHRAEAFKRRKFRLRRYGSEHRIYLERKTRKGDRVAKRRSDVPLVELNTLTVRSAAEIAAAWPGIWFHQRINEQSLQPSCRITYDRVAFVQAAPQGRLRLTLDRRIRGAATSQWDLTPVNGEGRAILPDEVICEFKFRGGMPNLFKQVIADLRLEAGSVSKYRRMMVASGFVPIEGTGNA